MLLIWTENTVLRLRTYPQLRIMGENIIYSLSFLPFYKLEGGRTQSIPFLQQNLIHTKFLASFNDIRILKLMRILTPPHTGKTRVKFKPPEKQPLPQSFPAIKVCECGDEIFGRRAFSLELSITNYNCTSTFIQGYIFSCCKIVWSWPTGGGGMGHEL